MSATVISIYGGPKTYGSRKVYAYLESNGYKRVQWPMSPELASMLASLAKKKSLSQKDVITQACRFSYQPDTRFMPEELTRLGDPSLRGKRFTWYAPVELYENMTSLGDKWGCGFRELIDTALFHFYGQEIHDLLAEEQ
ncbi:MAG: hypothetical protein KF892_24260 [Rhizobacter sp.]|nr:hypothetical protein [Rhizobacter sp.]